MTGRALLVTPVVPARGGNGLAMRAGVCLEALARDHEVSLLVVPVAGPAATDWPAFVRERTVERAALEPREDPAFPRTAALAPLRAYPRPALSRFATAEAVDEARRLGSARPFDLIHVLRLYLAPLVACATGGAAVLDLDDDEVETRRRLGSLHARLGQAAPMALEAAEADKYRAFEHEWVMRFDRLLVCSEADRGRVAGRTGHPAVRVVPNAVWRSGPVPPPPDGPPRLLFVGSLGYVPNADAATVLCREVLPSLGARLGREVLVDVAGSRPSRAVRDLARIPGVTVHADPASVAPLYARAHAAVLPIRAGGGTRIKVLEAFAHGVPVVSTSLGVEGLDVEPGRHALVADDPHALAAACARVLTDPARACRLRAEALALVAARYDAAVAVEAWRGLYREVAASRG